MLLPSTMSSTSEDDIFLLQSNLKMMERWAKESGSGGRCELDREKKHIVQSVKEILDHLDNQPPFALTWSYGKMLVAHVKGRKVSNASDIQKILSTFYLNLDGLDNHQVFRTMESMWKLLLENGNHLDLLETPSPSKQEKHSCLLSSFLKKCLFVMRKDAFVDFVFQVVLQSCVPCLLHLIEHESTQSHMVLDVLFMQLLEPVCLQAKEVAKCVLKSCGSKACNVIREMFHGVLSTGNGNIDQLSSSDHVYQILIELLLINNDLVCGVINNTELCLKAGRADRLEGLQFFCKLFSAKEFPGLPNPVELYSHLWHQFLGQNISLCEPQELQRLAEYTSAILSQPSTHSDWCDILFYYFQYILPVKSELCFVSEIANYLQDNGLLSNGVNLESLLWLVKNFLTPGSEYERFGEARILLLDRLGGIYQMAAKTGVNNWTLLSVHEMCSKLLSCFFATCGSLAPTNDRWIVLRKHIVKNLVPYNMTVEIRMEMLLYMWIHAGLEWYSVLHELFSKIMWTRRRLINILHLMKDKATAKNSKHLILQQLRELTYLVYANNNFSSGRKFVCDIFPAKLAKSPKLRSLIMMLLSENATCANNYTVAKEVRELFNFIDDEHFDTFKVLLYYSTELICDRKSLKHLLRLVNSCVKGKEISSSMGMPRLHVAKTALHLLHEMLFMLPHLGFDSDVLKYILDWAKPMNGSLSMLALRCLSTLASYRKLDIWNYDFTMHEVLPILLQIIEAEPRGQVKVAIRCIAGHLTKERDAVLRDVLSIIESQVQDQSKVEDLERGVSAMGHFSAICPISLKETLVNLCDSILIRGVVGSLRSEEVSSESSFDCSSNNTWVDWQELSPHIAIKVQALRSIGRCMRFCGRSGSVHEALMTLENILLLSMDSSIVKYRPVDIDRFKYEAASAILNIFENPQFHSLVSRNLLLALSKILQDPRIEVRCLFAEKLCQGLSPHKERSDVNGHSRGKLPPCFLGLLAVLGTDLWMNHQKEKAVEILMKVFISRHLAALRKTPDSRISSTYTAEPDLVLENTLAIAIPILVEETSLQCFNETENSGDDEIASEPLRKIAKSLKLVCSMICHPSTKGGQVSKDYMTKMVEVAKKTIYSVADAKLVKKYAMAFQVLDLVVNHYQNKDRNSLLPQVVLPPPFYSEDTRDTIISDEKLLSVSVLRKLERSVYGSKEQGRVKPRDSAVDNDTASTESDLLDDDHLSSFADSEQLSVSEEPNQSSGSFDSSILGLDATAGSSIRKFFGVPVTHSTPCTSVSAGGHRGKRMIGLDL